MNWVETVKTIYQKLDANGFNHISKEIQDEQLKGGTGGEMFTLVVAKLISIKDDQPEVYALIEDETERMIKYARSINYI